MSRALDVIVALVLLVVLSPILVLVAVLIRLGMGSPVIFTQLRTGLHGRVFKLYKFRTMTRAVDDSGRLLSDAERITTLGRFLRSTSIDELPELWNVLKGDMALVGPRPLLPDYLPLYNPTQARRHEVKPGLTGWAQVHGRNALTWEEKFELDVWYVDHRSLLLDLRILLMTVTTILSGKGINHQGEVAMAPFRGSPPRDCR